MAKVKIECDFCGKTNTKFEPQYVSSGPFGLGSTKVGEREVVDEYSKPFYRCVGCGRFYCEEHHSSVCFKKESSFLSTKRWYECPKCNSKQLIKV